MSVIFGRYVKMALMEPNNTGLLLFCHHSWKGVAGESEQRLSDETQY